MKTWKHYTIFSFLVIFSIMVTFIACDDGNTGNIYNISFDANNGSPITTQKVNEGNQIIKPSNPTKGAWSFDYWFDATTNIEWDFNTIVTKDISLKAKWTIKALNENVFLYTDLNTPFSISGVVILEIYITGSEPIILEVGSVDNGKLNFILPETLSANDWRTIYQSPSDGSTTYDNYRYDVTVNKNTVIIDPSDAKCFSLQLRVKPSTSNRYYYLDYYNEINTNNESISNIVGSYVWFGYHNKSATVLGENDTTRIITYFNDNNKTTTTQSKITYDWILNQGWNIFYDTYESIYNGSDPNAIIQQNTTNASTNHSLINIADLKWVMS